jgi:hypothetical protein
VGLIIALFLIVGGGTVYFMTKTDNGDVAATPDQASATQVESSQAATPVEPKSLPDDYPSKEAPIYQPGTIEMAMGIGSGGWLVVLDTNDDITTVAESIAREYEALGANVTQTPLNEDNVGQTVASLGGYGTIMTYHVDTEKNVTQISYSVNKQIQ